MLPSAFASHVCRHGVSVNVRWGADRPSAVPVSPDTPANRVCWMICGVALDRSGGAMREFLE